MKRSTAFATATLLAVGLMTWAAVDASAQPERCPAEISPASVKVTAAAGWEPFIPFPLLLHSAGMSAGPPGSFSKLRGEPFSKTTTSVSTRYAFDDTFREGAWLDCRYGEAGEVLLVRRLAVLPKQCTITQFKQAPGEPRRVDIDCR